MKITFLGTGAAEGVPAQFCNCDFCNSVRALGQGEVRTRSQVLIDENLLIDFPPEAYYHSFAFGFNLSRVKTLLVTHSHMDHFYAHDFILRGYKYATLEEDVLTVYGNEEVYKVFRECTAREMKPEVEPHVRFEKISSYSVFTADGCKIIALPAEHTNKEDALLFYVEREGNGYLHLHDTGNLSAQAIRFLKQNGAKANVVAYDCTFGGGSGNLSARHMGIEDASIIRCLLEESGITDGETKNVLTHFSHNCKPYRADMEKLASSRGFLAAHDGMVINV